MNTLEHRINIKTGTKIIGNVRCNASLKFET